MSRYFPPRPKPQLRERGVASVEINGKPRPAIVVRLFQKEGRAVVLCGTGTQRSELVVLAVPQTTAAGKALRLTKDTYFYADQLRSVRLSHLQPEEGYCPPALFLQVRLLVEGALSVLASGELTKDLAEGAAPEPVAPGTEP